MTTDGRYARHLRRPILAALVAATAAGTLLLSGCSSSGGAADVGGAAGGSGGSSAAGASPAAASTAIPTQDVVSSIQTDPKLKAELPASVQRSGKLILGTTIAPGTAGLPHAGQTADGTNVGLDVDLRNAVAKELGVTWDVQNGTFATIIPGVQNGKYQVGQDNFGATKAREQIVDFATYLNDGQAFLGASSVKVNSVSSITDVCGYTIATTPGSTFQTLLTSSASKCAAVGKKPWTVQYFSDSAPIFLGLANGKVDIFFGPTLSLKYDATHIPNTKFLGQISSTPVGFVTAKGSPIAKALSDAVDELITSGAYAKIFDKWGVGGIEITKSSLNPATTF